MKVCAVIFLSFAALCVVAEEKYTSRFDSVDINSILKNPRVLKHYVNCLVDAGPCTKEGRELRKHIPEALVTSCRKCTDAQKNFVRLGSKALRHNNPEYWKMIVDKYDPDGRNKEQFNRFLNEQ